MQNFFAGISSCPNLMGRTSKKGLSPFGQQLAVLIIKAGYASRSDFARVVGMTPSNLARLMRQKELPGPEKRQIFAQALHCTDHDLINVTPQTVDKTDEVTDRIPPSRLTLSAEGPMKDQIDQLVGALAHIPKERRQALVDRFSEMAFAEFHESRKPGLAPGKMKFPPGKG